MFARAGHGQSMPSPGQRPFGIKPLYYHNQGTHWHFASEMKALFEWGVKRRLALNGTEYIHAGPICSPLQRHWSRMSIDWGQGGHLTVDLKSNRHQISRYIKPTQHRYCSRFEHAIEDYEQRALPCSRSTEMLSDVPVGVLLSGGIDLALVAAMAAEGHCPHAHSWVWY